MRSPLACQVFIGAWDLHWFNHGDGLAVKGWHSTHGQTCAGIPVDLYIIYELITRSSLIPEKYYGKQRELGGCEPREFCFGA